MLNTLKHNDPNKHLLDQKDIEKMALEGSPSTNRLLDAINPKINELSEKDHSKRNEIVDKLLGIHGGKHTHTVDQLDSPEDFGWGDNWTNGYGYETNAAKQIAAYDKLSPHQIEHIKRYGTPNQKFELFNNPSVDIKHHNEMFGKYLNDDHDHGYDLDTFKRQLIKKKGKDINDFYEDAQQAAQEEHPFDEWAQENTSDEDWVGTDKDSWVNEFAQDSEDPDADWDNAVKDAKSGDTPDHLYDDYNEFLSDTVREKAQELKDKEEKNPHENEEYLPEHLKGKLSSIEEIKENNRRKLEEKDREKAALEEERIKPTLDTYAPNRTNKHEYGEGQHNLEMAKKYADSNGGSIDIGTLNKMHPNLKDKWKSMFGDKGKLKSEEIEQKLNELPKTPYNISYGHWEPSDPQNINGQDEVIVRLDHSPDSIKPIRDDAKTNDVFRKIADVSKRSKHPTNANTIAWARVDMSDPKNQFIDELQSDFGSTARDYLKNNGKDEDAEAVNKIIDYHKNWRENLLNAVSKLARNNGAEAIYTHTPESKAAHTHSDTVHTVYKDSYDKVPKSLGFKPVEMDELPLSEKGIETFKSGKKGASAKDLIAMHEKGAMTHSLNAQFHSTLKQKAESEGNSELADAHDKLMIHSADMYKKHRSSISQMDPTHKFVNYKTPKSFVENYGDPFHTAEEQVPLAAKNAQQYLETKSLPKYNFDSALDKKPSASGHKGMKLDINPKVIKKNLEYINDLMKSQEISNELRAKVAYTLKGIQDNQDVVDNLQKVNPSAYAALNKLVQSMIDLFQSKTHESPEDVLNQLEAEAAAEEEEAQKQQAGEQQGGQQSQESSQGSQPQESSQGSVVPNKDTPLHRRKMVYAPGSVRNYNPQSEKIKEQDGNWSSFKGGIKDPNGGQSGQQ
jgi:hypothetical protein